MNLRALIGKLNSATRGTVDGAAGLCLSRTHYDVEIEHFLVKALDASDGDVAQIVKHFGVNRSRLADDLARGLDRLKSGNARTPALSPTLVKMLTEGWTAGSIEFGAPQIRTGHCLLALLSNSELARLAMDISREFEKVAAEVLRKEFLTITAPSAEASAEAGVMSTGGGSAGAASSGGGVPSGGKGTALGQFTVDLTARAREGKIDPVLGRDFEIRQLIDILTRRRQNNPILVGEAGVGKSAVVEGFARRVVEGDVPEPLKNITIRTLDLALLQAGAGVKGEFENRLKSLIEEVKNSPSPIILFIDEAHTMIGAGGAAGQGDAANLLKPALARGELRTVAATTWAEYKKFFEKDPALSRRFQLVKVDEPGEDQCLIMLRGVVPALEAHHNVRITDDGLDAAVRLSHRYLPDRQLPDKAVSVLDTACARLALGQQATPAPVEDVTRRLDDLAVQARVLEREAALGVDHSERLGNIATMRTEKEAELASLKARWDEEKSQVDAIRGLRSRIEAAHAAMRTSAAKIEDPNKPKGVFMLVGPSGVGKTETALAMSDLLFGGEHNIITINMSEFQEAHTVSTLKGSPPGYVGYGEGGVLTEAVRRRPYSVVLLDEVEKAHPDVLELFFQVFDKGVMDDGEGRQIDFKNSIILLTSNAGTDTIMALTADPETMPTPEGLVQALKPELNKVFKPAFLGRMVIVPYFPVRDENMKKIVRLKLGKIERRLRDTHKMVLEYDETLVDAVTARCTEVESGARNVDNILTNTMLPELSRLILESLAGGDRPARVRVSVSDAGEFDYDVTGASASAV
ncbi:MAG: ATP-dependent Clp protease ATP-binding subunit [Gemmatimonadetes bacterium]|nr:ATP-dependent Clp protease ATP-binding subunit [Gemmatimonadota bacterium]